MVFISLLFEVGDLKYITTELKKYIQSELQFIGSKIYIVKLLNNNRRV